MKHIECRDNEICIDGRQPAADRNALACCLSKENFIAIAKLDRQETVFQHAPQRDDSKCAGRHLVVDHESEYGALYAWELISDDLFLKGFGKE